MDDHMCAGFRQQEGSCWTLDKLWIIECKLTQCSRVIVHVLSQYSMGNQIKNIFFNKMSPINYNFIFSKANALFFKVW